MAFSCRSASHALFAASLFAAAAAEALPTGGAAAGKALTQARAGGGGSSGTYGAGSVTVQPDLFTGALLHTIPIEVVPGRRGMQPSLALLYRSANGNGQVGVGWELSTNSIERRQKDGLQYDGDDYILRAGGSAVDLVNIAPGEYRVKFESTFQRIRRFTASDNANVVYWEVTDRNGTHYLYGETAAARQDNPLEATRVFGWMLDRVQDTNGNYMSLTYTKSTGEIYPSRIDYTAHTSGLAATNSVTFGWEGRSDAPLMWTLTGEQDAATGRTLGFQTQITQRLHNIDVTAGGLLVRRYELGYTASTVNGRSLLTSLTQRGKDGTSALPVTSFDYSAPPGIGLTPANPLNSDMYGGWNGANIRQADVDGDGYEDVVLGPDVSGNWFVMGGSPQGFINRGQWATNAFGYLSQNDPDRRQMWVGDFNGDGKQDIVILGDGAGDWSVMLSTGTSFGPVGEWGTGYGEYWGHPSRVRAFDVDGDGTTDLLIGPDAAGTFHLLRSNGTSFEDKGAWVVTNLPGWDSDAEARIFVADFTGDGLLDIALGPTAPNGSVDPGGAWYVLKNTGSGFAAPQYWVTQTYAAWATGNGPQRIRPMDVNGDGKADIVVGPDASGNWFVMLSTGASFADRGAWLTGAYGAWSNDPNPLRIRPLDVNGDGMKDIVIGPDGSGTWFVVQSTGTGFSDSGGWVAGIGVAPWDQAANQDRIRAMDVNGDGRGDIILGPDASGNWYGGLGLYPASDLLTHLRNGYGATTTIEYQPSTRFSNTQLPIPMQLVTAISIDDGNGLIAKSEYAYQGGYYHLKEKEFRGFASATVTGPVWPGGARTQTTTYFHQGNDVLVGANEPSGPVGYMKGKPYRVVAGDTVSAAFTLTETTYQDAAVAPYFDPATQVVTSYCANATTCGRQVMTTISYDTFGNAAREDHYGDTSDPNDDLTIVRSFDPNVTAWIIALPMSETTYSGAGAAVLDPANQLARSDFSYDGTGDCNVAPGGVTSPIVGNLTRATAWLNGGTGPETGAAYDSYGNRVCSRDPRGNVTRVTVDGSGTFAVSVTNALGQAATTAYYGVNGVAWSSSATDPGLYGMVKSTTDPNLATTTLQYDVFGRNTAVVGPDQVTTTRTYNALGTVGSQNVSTAAPTATDQVYFDGLGRTILARHQGSSTGRSIVVTTSYLSTGVIARTTAPYFESGGTPRYTSVTYDVFGRALAQTNPDATTVRSCYDDLAGVLAMTDANGRRRREVQNAVGQTIRIDEYLGTFSTCTTEVATPYATTTYSFDPLGRLEEVMDAKNSPVTISYDTLGRRILVSDPDLGNWTYDHDLAGNVSAQHDANGNTITFQYDALNRVVLKHFSNPAVADISSAYDDPAVPFSKGRLTKLTDGTGSTSYFYDNLGRLVSKKQVVDAATFTTDRAFDSATRRPTTLTYPDPNNPTGRPQIAYQYDADGNLSAVADPTQIYATLSNYDEYGRPGRIAFGNGAVTIHEYDPVTRRLMHIKTTLAATTLLDLNYGYDPDGNVTAVNDAVTPANSQTYTYDDLNRLVRAQSASYMSYPWLSPQGLSYTYDPVRVHLVNTLSDGRSFTYDGNGNTTAAGARQQTWDLDNHLTSVSNPGVTLATFAYDGTGARIKKQGGGVTVVYSGGLMECAGSSCTRYIYAGPMRVAAVTSSGVQYFHGDHLGSTRVLTYQDALPTSARKLLYQPFGGTISDSSSGPLHWGFTGQELDSETGLCYYRARYYDPSLGRFISADGVVPDAGDPQMLNRYAYASNNPTSNVDPSGHLPIPIVTSIVGAIVGGTVAVVSGDNVLRGMATGAITGFALGMGDVGVAAAGLKGTAAAVGIYAASGAAAGATNAAIYNGNPAVGAATGAVFAAIGSQLPPYIKLFDDGWPKGIQLAANRVLTAGVYGAGESAALAGMTGENIVDRGLNGAKWGAIGGGINLGVGMAVGFAASRGHGPTSIDRDKGTMYFENAVRWFRKGDAISIGGVVTARASTLDLAMGANTIRDHEDSHAGSQSAVLNIGFLPAQSGSMVVGGVLNSIGSDTYQQLFNNFLNGTHWDNVFENWWNEVPDAPHH
jgi:RHS repeat-associated protein